ncbi:hypothetical protein ACLESO_45705 [Pyxidicoccus sp. 3LG]
MNARDRSPESNQLSLQLEWVQWHRRGAFALQRLGSEKFAALELYAIPSSGAPSNGGLLRRTFAREVFAGS